MVHPSPQRLSHSQPENKMDLQLSDEQQMIRKMAADLAVQEITPIAAEIDKAGRFPNEIMAQLAQVGLTGLLIAPPYGGAGGGRAYQQR